MNYPSLSLGFLLGLVTASLVFSFAKPGPGASAQGSTRLRIAHSQPTSHPVHAGLQYFADRATHHSGGRLQFDLFPNGQLGSEPQSLEQIQAGTLDITKVGGATLGSFIPIAKVFSLPFLFRDSDHYWEVLNGEIGQELLDALGTTGSGRSSGLRGLTYYDAGSRNFYAQRPILTPSDLRGMKIRVMDDPVAIETMRAMGASPTPISWGELYTALQQGVVDGAENNQPSFVSSRHFEVSREFSLSHHSRIPDVLIISERTWSALSEEEREWIQMAADESQVFQRQAWDQGMRDALAQMAAEGVTVHEVDLAPFAAATESVRARFATDRLLDLVQRIQEVGQ